MRLIHKLLLCLMALPLAHAAHGQADAYPSRPIRIIVPFPPGGGTDTVARLVASKLTESWKVPVLVDNRPGGNTLIGAEMAARAAPDGYTLFLPIESTLAMNQSLYAKLPYDPINGFTPISLAITMPMVLAVHPAVPVHNVKELIGLARQQPGKMSYAHGALTTQVAGAAFNAAAKVDMVAIPYKGSSPAMADVVGGQVPVIFDALGPAMAFVKSGKVRALAVTGPRRTPQLPDVPTLAEAGVPGVDLVGWIGFVAPAGTDRAIVNKLNTEITRILKLPETAEKLGPMSMEIVASGPEHFARTVKEDAARLGAMIKSLGVRLD